MVILFPLHNVRSECECVHTMRVGMVLVVWPYDYHTYSDKHTIAREAIQISPPNLYAEGGSLFLPIYVPTKFL